MDSCRSEGNRRRPSSPRARGERPRTRPRRLSRRRGDGLRGISVRAHRACGTWRRSLRVWRTGPTCLRRGLEWHGGKRRREPTNHGQRTRLRVLRPFGTRRDRGSALALRRCARLGRPCSTRRDGDRLRLVVAHIGSFSPDAFEWFSFGESTCLGSTSELGADRRARARDGRAYVAPHRIRDVRDP